jgi:N-carbamoyl-L-amino-acid hydrolase
MAIAISLPRLRSRIEALSRFGRHPRGQGISRFCWSPEHERARAWLIREMARAGLATWVDAAGNTFGRLGQGPRSVMTGSHIDTVPHGGPLDGALGVLAGLECLHTLRERRVRTRLPLTLAAWSDEEGRYAGLFGSRAFIGRLDPAAIADYRSPDGDRLVDAMKRAGFDARKAPRAKVDPAAVEAYVELHIEQGPRLERAGIPIGVVTGIVGSRRSRLTFLGQADHAGTTPMAWRRDAFLAAADYALRAREHIVRAGSPSSVTNFGRIEVFPGASNVVPERAVLLHEMRDLDRRVLERLERDCGRLARTVARRRGVRVAVERLTAGVPAACSPRIVEAVESAARALRLRTRRMPSGAGHDAQNLARITDSGMLFIPSRGGRSHRPDEQSDWRAIERGANVLLHTLLELAG